MKKILIPVMLLAIVACGSSEKSTVKVEQESIAVAPIGEPVAEMLPSAEVVTDAVTGATSKPTQVSFNGTIVVPPQSMATVSLNMGGIVRHTSLIPGQTVTKGAVLATLENPDFIALQQTYLDSHIQTEYLKTEYERQQTLSAEQAASQKRVQQSKADYMSMKSRMEAAAAQLMILGVSTDVLLSSGIQPSLQVKAPISGYVVDVQMNVGKFMDAGDVLCELVNTDNTMLRLKAYEKDLANIRVGSAVEFVVNGMGDSKFEALILSIGQRVDEVTRSVDIFAKIINGHSQFRPGMYVTAKIDK